MSLGSTFVQAAAWSLGGGVVGSAITTYTTQYRERAAARSAFREAVRAVSALSPTAFASEGEGNRALLDGLREVEGAGQAAGVPRRYVDLYRSTASYAWMLPMPGVERSVVAVPDEDAMPQVYHTVQRRLGSLLLDFAWHPWLARPRCEWCVRRFRLILFGADPHLPRRLREIDLMRQAQDRRLIAAGKRAKRIARREAGDTSRGLATSAVQEPELPKT